MMNTRRLALTGSLTSQSSLGTRNVIVGLNKLGSISIQRRSLKVAVIGGSMSGLFAARSLSQSSSAHDIHIFERTIDKMSGGGLTVTTPMMEYMDKYQIFDSPEVQDANMIPTVTTSTIHSNGELEQHIHPETVRRHTSWDCLYHSLLTPDLSRNLQKGKNLINITTNTNNDCKHLMKIEFDDTTSFDCDIVIGADGVGSNARTFISKNRGTEMEYAGYMAWRGIVDGNDIQETDPMYNWRTDHQWVLYHGMNTQFLNYTIPNSNACGVLYNWVWYVKYDVDELRDAIFLVDKHGKERKITMPRGLLPEYCLDYVHCLADELLEETCGELVKMTKEPFFQVIHDYKCNSMVEYFHDADNKREGGIVLVGDAAFVLRPHTTKATSKAAGDAMCFEKYLSQWKDNKDENIQNLQDVLVAYNAERWAEGNDLSNKSIELGNKVVLQTKTRVFNQEYVRSSN